jgi:hypothetical protein
LSTALKIARLDLLLIRNLISFLIIGPRNMINVVFSTVCSIILPLKPPTEIENWHHAPEKSWPGAREIVPTPQSLRRRESAKLTQRNASSSV